MEGIQVYQNNLFLAIFTFRVMEICKYLMVHLLDISHVFHTQYSYISKRKHRLCTCFCITSYDTLNMEISRCLVPTGTGASVFAF